MNLLCVPCWSSDQQKAKNFLKIPYFLFDKNLLLEYFILKLVTSDVPLQINFWAGYSGADILDLTTQIIFLK